MMAHAVIPLTVLVFTIQFVCFKWFSLRRFHSIASFLRFAAGFLGIGAALFWLWSGLRLPSGTAVWLYGGTFGICLAVNFYCLNRAFQEGPMGTASLFSSGSILVPVLCEVLLFGGNVPLLQGGALVVLFGGFFLFSRAPSPAGTPRPGRRFYLLCAGSVLGNGISMALLGAYQRTASPDEPMFLTAGFAVAALAAGAGGLLLPDGASPPPANTGRWIFPALVVLTAAVTALGNGMNLWMAAHLPPVAQFPAVIGGGVVANLLAGRLLFSEKLHPAQGAGCLVCILALCFLH